MKNYIRFSHIDGDHLTLLNAYHVFKSKGDNQQWCYDNYLNYRSLKAANDIREQLKQIMIKLGLNLVSTDFQSPSYYTNIKKCIIAGYFTQVCFAYIINYLLISYLKGCSFTKIWKLYDCKG